MITLELMSNNQVFYIMWVTIYLLDFAYDGMEIIKMSIREFVELCTVNIAVYICEHQAPRLCSPNYNPPFFNDFWTNDKKCLTQWAKQMSLSPSLLFSLSNVKILQYYRHCIILMHPAYLSTLGTTMSTELCVIFYSWLSCFRTVNILI